MKMEDHFKETLTRAVANEPPVVDAWDRFERRTQRGRRMRLFGAIAAAAAVAVAAVIVVPKLGSDSPQGRGIRFASPPPTVDPSPPPTVDPYAGWKTYENADDHYRLRHPADWVASENEGNREFRPPGLPGLGAGAEGTFGVDIAFFIDRAGYEISRPTQEGVRQDGREYAWFDVVLDDGARTRQYRIDWSEARCGAPPATCPAGDSMMLTASLIGEDTAEFFRRYEDIGELIIKSIERI